jgi:hypothetical protein
VERDERPDSARPSVSGPCESSGTFLIYFTPRFGGEMGFDIRIATCEACLVRAGAPGTCGFCQLPKFSAQFFPKLSAHS